MCETLSITSKLQGVKQGGEGRENGHLEARQNAVDDLDGAAVGMAWQGLADAVDLHLALGLRARLLAVNRLTRGTLEASVLRGGK